MRKYTLVDKAAGEESEVEPRETGGQSTWQVVIAAADAKVRYADFLDKKLHSC